MSTILVLNVPTQIRSKIVLIFIDLDSEFVLLVSVGVDLDIILLVAIRTVDLHNFQILGFIRFFFGRVLE